MLCFKRGSLIGRVGNGVGDASHYSPLLVLPPEFVKNGTHCNIANQKAAWTEEHR